MSVDNQTSLHVSNRLRSKHNHLWRFQYRRTGFLIQIKRNLNTEMKTFIMIAHHKATLMMSDGNHISPSDTTDSDASTIIYGDSDTGTTGFCVLYFIQREAGLETEMTKFIMIAHQKATLMMCQLVTTYRRQIQQTPMQAQSSMKIQSQAH